MKEFTPIELQLKQNTFGYLFGDSMYNEGLPRNAFCTNDLMFNGTSAQKNYLWHESAIGQHKKKLSVA
jgi:hypothetical protein